MKATLGLQGLEMWLLTGPYSVLPAPLPAPPPHTHTLVLPCFWFSWQLPEATTLTLEGSSTVTVLSRSGDTAAMLLCVLAGTLEPLLRKPPILGLPPQPCPGQEGLSADLGVRKDLMVAGRCVLSQHPSLRAPGYMGRLWWLQGILKKGL